MNFLPGPIRSLTVTAAALALCLASGCASFPWSKVPLDAASGFYEDAQLVYRLDAGKLGLPLDVVRVEGRQISYDQVASSPLADQSIGTLSVIYPHPSGNPQQALVRFALNSVRSESQPASTSWNLFVKPTNDVEAPTAIASTQPEVHETWELDIDRRESDEMFKMLTNVGFYTSDRPAGPARVTVKMQGREQTKNWDQLPALNLLIQRVRAQGRLVSYTRPRTPAGTAPGSMASTAAYRTLMAGRGPGLPEAATNAFAVAPPVPVQPAGPQMPIVPGAVGQPYPVGLAQRPPATWPVR